MISVEKLSKFYGQKQALNQISLQFEPGTVTGVAGENGAGKTTLFKCIAGIESFHGVVKSNFDVLKNHIGFVRTIPYFLSKMTGREYLQLLCNARGIGNPTIDAKNIFDLPLDEYAETYSTGMKKKLAFTAVLLQNNHVFILDEPFNGVDIQSNIIIGEIIHKLKALNKTVIMASHIFATLSNTCDQIHLLQKGQITQSVGRPGFAQLEARMKDITIGDKVERLNL